MCHNRSFHGRPMTGTHRPVVGYVLRVRVVLAALVGLIAVFSLCVDGTIAVGAQTGETCQTRFIWPLAGDGSAPPRIVLPFDPPEQPWLPGHRGVDLAADDGLTLIAPADCVIAFGGKVAGKSVVTLRHGLLTSTFEPAQTEKRVGSAVKRGQPFATVRGSSDHCDGVCIQWGVKRAQNDYLDPARQVLARRIMLKPM